MYCAPKTALAPKIAPATRTRKLIRLASVGLCAGNDLDRDWLTIATECWPFGNGISMIRALSRIGGRGSCPSLSARPTSSDRFCGGDGKRHFSASAGWRLSSKFRHMWPAAPFSYWAAQFQGSPRTVPHTIPARAPVLAIPRAFVLRLAVIHLYDAGGLVKWPTGWFSLLGWFTMLTPDDYCPHRWQRVI